MSKKFKGEQNLEMTELEWLIDHHVTKLEERMQMVEDLNLKPGDFVLDLGCGPGLWTNLLAEKVKPNGKVIGLDFAPCLIDYAKENIQEEHKNIIQFGKGDFNDLHFEKDTFDLVFFGNCLAYAEDQHKVLNEIKRVTKKGRRVVAKDFDGAVFIIHPIEPDLTLKVLTAAAQTLKENPLNPKFDNFTGRKMHGLFTSDSFKDVTTKSYAIQKFYPLSPETKRYITGNAEWYLKIGSPYLSDEDIRKWRSYFDPDSKNFILNSKDLYFCMLEIFTSGKV
jgi:ubiquinone/menaquinone biosynthesis C-methylase UbiE